MKTRQELKAIGKEQFKSNYWKCVLVMLLVSAVSFVITMLSNYGLQDVSMTTEAAVEEISLSPINYIGMLLSIFIIGPLMIGQVAFFIKNVRGDRDDLSVVTPFKEGIKAYGNKFGVTLLTGILVFLWSLLLIVPGIIKAFSYAMASYIVAENTNVKPGNAIKMSMRMMKGHKWEYFVLGLSFIGWEILSILTCGLVGVFYTNPYVQNTFAAYYLNLKENAIQNGIVSEAEFAGQAA